MKMRFFKILKILFLFVETGIISKHLEISDF